MKKPKGILTSFLDLLLASLVGVVMLPVIIGLHGVSKFCLFMGQGLHHTSLTLCNGWSYLNREILDVEIKKTRSL